MDVREIAPVEDFCLENDREVLPLFAPRTSVLLLPGNNSVGQMTCTSHLPLLADSQMSDSFSQPKYFSRLYVRGLCCTHQLKLVESVYI